MCFIKKKKKNWIVYESQRARIADGTAWEHKKLRKSGKETFLSSPHFLVLGLCGCEGFSGDKGLETQRIAEKSSSAFIFWASNRARSVGKQHSGRERGVYPLTLNALTECFQSPWAP